MRNSNVKNDLTSTMIFALRRAWQFKGRMPDRAFTAASCEVMEPTMHGLVNRGFVYLTTGISYELTPRGEQFCQFHFPLSLHN